MGDHPIGVLFVCTGNICRSPLAEGVFIHKIEQRGIAARFHVDSAGTGGWHVGDPADARMRRTAEARGVKLVTRARQYAPDDASTFRYLICMDESHREHLLEMGAPADRVSLLLEHLADAPMVEVPDPYYGGQDGFDLVYKLIEQGCDALIQRLLADHSADQQA